MRDGLTISLPNPVKLRAVVPLLGFVLLTIGALLYRFDYDLYVRTLMAVGVVPYHYPFVDWDGTAAAITCWKEGINVYQVNPCDVMGRTHDYSPLWLRASFIPYGPAWRNTVGLGLAVSFYASLYLVLRPQDWQEVRLLALACVSTMVLFAIERANIDVLIFCLLAVAASLATGQIQKRLTAYGLILLSALLKFYPIVGFTLLLRERPKAVAAVVAVVGFICLAFCYAFWSELIQAGAHIPTGLFLDRFGAKNLPEGLAHFAATIGSALGLPKWLNSQAVEFGSYAILVVLVTIEAVILVRNEEYASAFSRIDNHARVSLTLGSSIITGCFFGGQNIGYRGIFLIFSLAGLFSLRRELQSVSSKNRVIWHFLIIALLMWSEELRKALQPAPDTVHFVFWLFRELLWWQLIAVMLAMLATFTIQSEVFSAFRRYTGMAP